MRLKTKFTGVGVSLALILGAFMPLAQASALSATPASSSVLASSCGDSNHIRVSLAAGTAGHDPSVYGWAKLTLNRDTCHAWVRIVAQCYDAGGFERWLYGGATRIVGERSPIQCTNLENGKAGYILMADIHWQWYNGKQWINKSF